MAEDIAPELLRAVQSEYREKLEADKELAGIRERIEAGTADGRDMDAFAVRSGELLAKALHDHVSGDILPNGRMYYNIANRLLPPVLRDDYDAVAAAAEQIQALMNDRAGIQIRAQRPELNQDKVDGLVNLAATAEQYEDIRKELEGDVVNFSQSVATDSVKSNAEFQYQSGLSPKVERTAESSCCPWCQNLEGTYDYADIRGTGNEVWQRHRACRCVVEYVAAGKRQNAHTKQVSTMDREASAERIQRAQEAEKQDREQEQAEREERIRSAEELDNESLWMQEYRQTTRSNEVVNDVKFQEVELRRAVEYDHEIYLSENVTIKPRALHELDVQLSEAMRRYRGNSENRPKLAVLTSAEIGQNRVALYEPTNNTIYVIPEVGDRRRILDFQKDMACGDNPNATMYHEVWHWMQAEGYRERIDDITAENRGEYMRTIAEYAKKRLDAVGVNEYNVFEISDYAARKYSNGRFDETEAELHVRKALG